MSYTFPAPEHYPTDEENILEVVKYLSDGCWLADTVHKESSDTMTVHEHDHPAFFAEKSSYFDYPDARLLNEMIKGELLSVHISAWTDGARENPHYNLRHFCLTDKGQALLAEHDPKDVTPQ